MRISKMKYFTYLLKAVDKCAFLLTAPIALFLGEKLVVYRHDPVIGPNMRRKFGDSWLVETNKTLELIKRKQQEIKQKKGEDK